MSEIGEELFREIVKRWVQSGDNRRRELADAFEAAVSTVDRWWLGTVTPRQAIRVQIITWIRDRLRA